LSYTITSPPPIAVADTIATVGCDKYSVTVSVTGGTSPYKYSWSNGAQTQNLTGVSAGVYQVSVADAGGCVLTKEIKIDSVAPLTCSIKSLSQPPACNSSGNVVATDITNATYQWQLTSSDRSWSIQSGAAADSVIYSAGNINSTATFSLTATRNGCVQTCTYQVSTCTSSSGGGGGNNESCGDCFKSSFTQGPDGEGCIKYTVNISTDGNCRYDLSHVVVAIPSCGQLGNYSDSKGWPLTIGTDPTTGLTGLKVSNATSFGNAVDSFTIEFSVCGTSDCIDMLKTWNPVVAYKAGQCIAYDSLSTLQNAAASFSIYPNPVHDSVSIEMTTAQDDVATVDVFNQYGQKVGETITAPVAAYQKNTIKIDASSLPMSIYLYKVKTSKSSYNGRFLKSN
jgi:hypothetical protein